MLKSFFSLLLLLTGTVAFGQKNEIPLLGLKWVDAFVFAEHGNSYYYNTSVTGIKRAMSNNLRPFSVRLNKANKVSHSLIGSVLLAGDTVQTDSIISFYAQFTCAYGNRIFYLFNRIYPDNNLLPKPMESISLVVVDTNLNVIVPEKRIKTSYYPLSRLNGCHIQSCIADGTKLIVGYRATDTVTGTTSVSSYIISDLNGNVIKEDTIGVPPTTATINSGSLRHELAEILPYPNNRFLICGNGIATTGRVSYIIADSALLVIDTFHLKTNNLDAISANGYTGDYIQTPNSVVLPSGNLIAGRDLLIRGTSQALTALIKMNAAKRFDFDKVVIYPGTDNDDNYNSNPSLHNLDYNKTDGNVYYANANHINTGFVGSCNGNPNYIHIVASDTSLNTKWRKFISASPGSCAYVTRIAVSSSRPGIDILGQFRDALNTNDTSKQGSFLFHIDSTGTLDVPGSQHFSIRDRFRIYPNPARDLLNIDDVLAAVSTATIYDLQGRAVSTTAITANPARLSLKDLPPATYLLRLALKDGSTHSQLFSRQE